MRNLTVSSPSSILLELYPDAMSRNNCSVLDTTSCSSGQYLRLFPICVVRPEAADREGYATMVDSLVSRLLQSPWDALFARMAAFVTGFLQKTC